MTRPWPPRRPKSSSRARSATTHLTQGGDPLASGDEEEPELVFIDDDEFEAAHRQDDSFEEEDEYAFDDESELEFSFEEDLDEAIALDASDEMDPTVEEADERMAPLFTSQRELRDAIRAGLGR